MPHKDGQFPPEWRLSSISKEPAERKESGGEEEMWHPLLAGPAQAVVEGPARHSQHLRRYRLNTIGSLQGFRDQQLLCLFQGWDLIGKRNPLILSLRLLRFI